MQNGREAREEEGRGEGVCMLEGDACALVLSEVVNVMLAVGGLQSAGEDAPAGEEPAGQGMGLMEERGQ